MTPHRRRNDRQPGFPNRDRARGRAEDRGDWLWGWHAVEAALNNPARALPERVLVTPDRARALGKWIEIAGLLEIAEPAAIAQALPAGASHQGVALKAPPLDPTSLDELAASRSGFLVMLDQVTDPQNVGAVFRSAAAFGARGVILQDRHAPPLTGALAKAAAGAIDKLPHAREVNLSRALERLEQMGWRAVGLDGSAPEALETMLDERPTVIVLGAEGEGLRRLVAEHCDALASIPMPGGFESLNVSAAAAVALYLAMTSQPASARSTTRGK